MFVNQENKTRYDVNTYNFGGINTQSPMFSNLPKDVNTYNFEGINTQAKEEAGCNTDVNTYNFNK